MLGAYTVLYTHTILTNIAKDCVVSWLSLDLKMLHRDQSVTFLEHETQTTIRPIASKIY